MLHACVQRFDDKKSLKKFRKFLGTKQSPDLFSIRSTYRMMIEAKKSRENYFEGRTSCSDYEKKAGRMKIIVEY